MLHVYRLAVALAPPILSDLEDDLNDVSSGEDNGEYGALESGDEPEADDLMELDSDFDGSVIGDEADEIETKRDYEADMRVSASISDDGRCVSQLAGALEPNALKSMSTMGWNTPFEPNLFDHLQQPYTPVDTSNDYPGLLQGCSEPTAEALRFGFSPISLFST